MWDLGKHDLKAADEVSGRQLKRDSATAFNAVHITRI